MPYLLIEDFSTVGLEGDPLEYEDPEMMVDSTIFSGFGEILDDLEKRTMQGGDGV